MQSTVDATSDMDIFYNHNSHMNTAFLVSNAVSNDQLYMINTSTGMATIANMAGCDSIITINLTINNVNNTINLVDDTTLVATETGGMYQWINCATNQAIMGANAQTFAPTMNGNYAVIVTSASGCTDTSDCMMVSSLAISDLDAVSIELYPNPTNGKLNIQVQDSETHTVSVMDAMGRVVLPAFEMTSNTSIDLSTMNNGVYFVKIDQLVKQVVKR